MLYAFIYFYATNIIILSKLFNSVPRLIREIRIIVFRTLKLHFKQKAILTLSVSVEFKFHKARSKLVLQLDSPSVFLLFWAVKKKLM